MSEPWFNVATFGAWYGGLVGGIGGSLCGVLGGLAGMLAPQGKGRAFILGGMAFFACFGVANLLLGLVALLAGQPYGIWYGPLLCGLIFTVVVGSLIPVVRKRYREAEERRIQAEALRRS